MNALVQDLSEIGEVILVRFVDDAIWVTFRDGQSALAAIRKGVVKVCGQTLKLTLKTPDWVTAVQNEVNVFSSSSCVGGGSSATKPSMPPPINFSAFNKKQQAEDSKNSKKSSPCEPTRPAPPRPLPPPRPTVPPVNLQSGFTDTNFDFLDKSYFPSSDSNIYEEIPDMNPLNFSDNFQPPVPEREPIPPPLPQRQPPPLIPMPTSAPPPPPVLDPPPPPVPARSTGGPPVPARNNA